MNYREFQKLMLQLAQAMYQENAEVKLQKVRKNNGVILHGLMIRERNVSASPTIYLEPYYEAYCAGEDPGRIFHQIVCNYESSRRTATEPPFDVRDFKEVREKLTLRLVANKGNEAYLENTMMRPFLDLSLICYVCFDMEGFHGGFKVENNLKDAWGVSDEEFWTAAMESTRRLKPQLISIVDLLRELLPGQGIDPLSERPAAGLRLIEESEAKMYVLSVRDHQFGAVSMIYQELLKETERALRGGYYILPSSVHECIVLPESQVRSVTELQTMVREINETHVAQEEILSNSVYRYDPKTEKISIC